MSRPGPSGQSRDPRSPEVRPRSGPPAADGWRFVLAVCLVAGEAYTKDGSSLSLGDGEVSEAADICGDQADSRSEIGEVDRRNVHDTAVSLKTSSVEKTSAIFFTANLGDEAQLNFSVKQTKKIMTDLKLVAQ